MGAPSKNIRQARIERERMLILKHKFENRITTVRFGKECLDAGDYGSTIQRFLEYMATMAQTKNCKDLYHLKVSHFDPKKDITEMLMMSHVFFEMARIYDASPKFVGESTKCLEQFVHFSANQPYQVVNSELVRKHLNKGQLKNPQNFRNAYQQIYVQSRKCYVVTFCYGDDHPVTHDYRKVKDWLLQSDWGREFVRCYYAISSVVVPKWEHNPWMRALGTYLVRPCLLLFSKTVLPLIIRKC